MRHKRHKEDAKGGSHHFAHFVHFVALLCSGENFSIQRQKLEFTHSSSIGLRRGCCRRYAFADGSRSRRQNRVREPGAKFSHDEEKEEFDGCRGGPPWPPVVKLTRRRAATEGRPYSRQIHLDLPLESGSSS